MSVCTLCALQCSAGADVQRRGKRACGICLHTCLSAYLPLRYQKLLGRLKQEKQAAKLLRQQLAEERALAAGERQCSRCFRRRCRCRGKALVLELPAFRSDLIDCNRCACCARSLQRWRWAG